MSSWRPVLVTGVDIRSLPLTPEQGFLLSRIDGSSDLASLCALTGLSSEVLMQSLQQLVTLGAVVPNPEVSEGPSTEDELEVSDLQDAATHRQLFETQLHKLGPEERAARAKAADEPELSAFCFDPVPAVIHALLENSRFGLVHARLVAVHHRNPVGLEAMAGRAAFAADEVVRRQLTRNPQTPVGLFRRLFAQKRLLEQFKLTTSRDVSEQARRTARELLRQRFTSAPSEERVELIMKTEGRCLNAVAGIPVDGKTTAMLCGRTYSSTMFIQNLARWTAAPPALIAHLMRQELVKRSPMLRTLLERHPNAPSKG